MTYAFSPLAQEIDCVLSAATGAQVPAFWMTARDEGPARSFSQLMQAYRADPDI
jgi:hypothetical protein